jgi:hypothetical protein
MAEISFNSNYDKDRMDNLVKERAIQAKRQEYQQILDGMKCLSHGHSNATIECYWSDEEYISYRVSGVCCKDFQDAIEARLKLGS